MLVFEVESLGFVLVVETVVVLVVERVLVFVVETVAPVNSVMTENFEVLEGSVLFVEIVVSEKV